MSKTFWQNRHAVGQNPVCSNVCEHNWWEPREEGGGRRKRIYFGISGKPVRDCTLPHNNFPLCLNLLQNIVTRNCHFQSHHSYLTPLQGTLTNISINLILPETVLHFFCRQQRAILIQILVAGSEKHTYNAMKCV